MERRASLIRRRTTFTGGDGNDVFIPESARAGLRFISGARGTRSTADVARWLRDIDMAQYVAAFRDHGVSYDLLISLNNSELRQLGVKPLGHRRRILDAVEYLVSSGLMAQERALPEDGRILSHLSNMRNYLSWTRFGIFIFTLIVLLTRAPILGVTDLSLTRTAAVVMTLFGTLTHLYGTHRYFRLVADIENPGEHYSPDSFRVLLPALLGISVTIFVLFWLTYRSALKFVPVESAGHMAVAALLAL